MKLRTFSLAFALIGAPVFAENINVYITREDGGVTQQQGNVTAQEAALLMGDSAPPEGATGVVLERGEPPRWTNLSPQAVNEAFDGNGLPAAPGDAETAGDEMTFDDPDQEKEPSNPRPGAENLPDLLPEGDGSRQSAKIRPLAGNWIGVSIDQTFEGCPPGIAEAVTAQTSALDLSEIQGDISPSFDPSVSIPQFQWTPHGPNAWIGDLDMIQNGTGMRVQLGMRVMSPTLINGRQQIDVVGPMMGVCTIFMRYQYERTG